MNATGPRPGPPEPTASELARRSGSFGVVADTYRTYRPGPSPEVVAWLLPDPVSRVVDLGAGTGALTRLLVARADEVVAVEPDARMRAVLAADLPDVRAVDGRGDDVPLPDGTADAVLASSSWHWMDVGATVVEVARILRPGGLLAALWTGPDPEGPFLTELRAVLAARSAGGPAAGDVIPFLRGGARRLRDRLALPEDAPFGPTETRTFRWELPRTADDLVGLVGTFSTVITLPDDERSDLLDGFRRVLEGEFGLGDGASVAVTFRSQVHRARLVA